MVVVVAEELKHNMKEQEAYTVEVLIPVTTPEPEPDPIGESEPKPGERPFNSFILHVIKFSFSKVSRPESPSRPERWVRTGARFTPTFSFILSKHLFMLFRFKVFNYAEAFSNGRPINIYIFQNSITKKAFYAFLNKTKH